ncbi:uncharacterized protein LOC144337273 isoform X2 [Macaca mulatta]
MDSVSAEACALLGDEPCHSQRHEAHIVGDPGDGKSGPICVRLRPKDKTSGTSSSCTSSFSDSFPLGGGVPRDAVKTPISAMPGTGKGPTWSMLT